MSIVSIDNEDALYSAVAARCKKKKVYLGKWQSKLQATLSPILQDVRCLSSKAANVDAPVGDNTERCPAPRRPYL